MSYVAAPNSKGALLMISTRTRASSRPANSGWASRACGRSTPDSVVSLIENCDAVFWGPRTAPSLAPGGVAHDQLRLEDHTARPRSGLLQQRSDHPGRALAHLLRFLVDARERHVKVAAVMKVSAAHDGQVPGNAQPGVDRLDHGAQGHRVVKAEDAVRPRAQREERLHGVFPAGLAVGVGG